MKVLTSLVRKAVSVDDIIRLSGKTHWVNVDREIQLSDEDYSFFVENLLEEYDFLPEGEVVLISNPSTDGIIVDTQGYGYPRYTGLVFDIKE